MMTRFRQLLCLLGVICSCAPTLSAQNLKPRPPVPGAPAASAAVSKDIPPLPVAKSPVVFFRELLAMQAGERSNYLSNRPPEARLRILEKLKEYEALTPDEREARLQMTELRWHVLLFMHNPSTNRTEQLATLAEPMRRLVSNRLQQWDLLPPQEQKEVLEYQSTLQVFVGQDRAATNVALASFPASQREALLRSVNRWNELSVEQRQQRYALSVKFFELTDDERSKSLQVLSLAERRQMEVSLRLFANLPADRREQCLSSFDRFASMSVSERDEFLKNAERWKEMSAAERATWRNLVHRLPPPPTPPPPVPSAPRQTSTAQSTNSE